MNNSGSKGRSIESAMTNVLFRAAAHASKMCPSPTFVELTMNRFFAFLFCHADSRKSGHPVCPDKLMQSLILSASLALLPAAVLAGSNPEVVKAVEEYMDFSEYGSSLIWPEQIPEGDWKTIFVVDARDAPQYAKDHIPGAVNIEWRQAVARRAELPTDRMVVFYCNSGSLSAQAVFALRLLGHDNVKVLQDGFEGWKAKGGFEANQRAMKPAGH
jgi:rhodanese-related sulfurtransferase